MRPFKFLLLPIVGIVFLFFFLKVLLLAMFGIAAAGLVFMAVRHKAGRRFSGLYVASMQRRQPEPIDSRYQRPQAERPFDWAQGNRMVEVI